MQLIAPTREPPALQERDSQEEEYLQYLSFENVIDQSVDFDKLFESIKTFETEKVLARRTFTIQLEEQQKQMGDTSPASSMQLLQSASDSPLACRSQRSMSF